MIFAAMLRLDGDVNQFVVSAKQRAIGIAALWFVRDDRDHRRIFPDADLPDVQIGYERIASALHSFANLIRQIRGCRGAIEQNAAGIAHKCVSPGKNDAAPDNSDGWIEPRPSEEF